MSLEHVGVIGAGTMGNGIAQVCAMAGRDVLLLDLSSEALERGVAAMMSGLERLERKGEITATERRAAFAKVRATTVHADLGACDLVVESATENSKVKVEILRRIESILAPGALIATNTSSISITHIAAHLEDPSRCIGLHFFNPVPAMALVEVIRGLQTSDDAHSRAVAFAEGIGKTPISVRNSPGFVVNRILIPMINEAILAVQEQLGSVHDIDTAMRIGGGHPVGPLRLADLVGLDVVLAVMEVLQGSFGDPKYRPAVLLRDMVHAGRLGRKSGQGFYVY